MFGKIISKKDGAIFAQAPVDDIIHIKESHYFRPEDSDLKIMEISERTYNCPRKGICNWIDVKSNAGYLNDIAWVYPETKPDFKHIAGRYGFYDKHKFYEYKESE